MHNRSVELAPGLRIHGFIVERCQDLPDVGSRAWIMRHLASGTPLMWLENDDENMSFSIAFKTPPADDTGVFHILEHSVLCGSDRYPVKEPFVDLLKTSMQTFLNAMTFPDKTLYPVASTNERDLLNLMDVYLDAVFHPALHRKPQIFEQEGWHLELDGDGLRYNGVVFNEMKGAASDPDDVVVQGLCEALFPDTCYGHESGGDPSAIPSLTYGAFVDAHRRHYRPDNARVFLYGAIGLEDELALLDEGYLSRCEGPVGDPNPLDLQAPVVDLTHVKHMCTPPENAAVALGYVLGTYRDRRRVLACDILADALFGSNEAPLKRLLLDEGLGDDVDAFVYDGIAQPFLAIEVRGAAEEAAGRLVEIVDREFARMAREGVPRDNLEASLESTAFSLRERDYGYADGVALASACLSGWLYDDAAACDYLEFEEDLAALREGLRTGWWETLVAETLVGCTHKGCCELVPVEEGAGSPASRQLDELAKTLAAMDGNARNRVAAHAQKLKELQSAPDAPEDRATLPRLGVGDIRAEKGEPACEMVDCATTSCLYHTVETRRIDYAYHYFDLSCLSWDELPWATLLTTLLGRLGTGLHPADELDRLLESRLGRLTFSCAVQSDYVTGEPTPRLVVGASAIEENVRDLATLPAEVWGTTDFGDLGRIHEMLVQQRIDAEQSFAASGHRYALGRAHSYTSKKALLGQRLGSVDYYRFVCDLLREWDALGPQVAGRLEDVRRRVFSSGRDFHSFAGRRADLAAFWDAAGDLRLAQGGEAGAPLSIPEPGILNEAFVVPSDVCFVAKADDGGHTGAGYTGAWAVAARAASYGYLWDTVRVQGGAYGCGLKVRSDGSIGLYSYRDPRLDETLDAFDRLPGWFASGGVTASDLEGYVVSTVASRDAPVKPRRVVHRQDLAHLTNTPADWRATVRSEALACTEEQIAGFAPHLERVAQRGAVCVFGGRRAIESSSADLTVIDLLPERD